MSNDNELFDFLKEFELENFCTEELEAQTAVEPESNVYISINDTSIERHIKFRKRRNIIVKRRQYNYSDEQYSLHFFRCCRKFIMEIEEEKNILHRELFGIEILENHTPTSTNYVNLLKKLKTDLQSLDKNMPVDRFFENGPEDTALIGKYLIYMQDKWTKKEKDEKQAIAWLGAMQWLIDQIYAKVCYEESQKEYTDVSPQETQKEPVLTSYMHTLLIDKLHLDNAEGGKRIHLGDRNYLQGQILAMVKCIYHDKGMEWAKSTPKFAEKIAPILNKSSGSISKLINRALIDIKGVDLKNISLESIQAKTSYNASVAKRLHTEWEGLYELVLQAVEHVSGHD